MGSLAGVDSRGFMLGLMQGNTLGFCQHQCLLEPVKGFNLRLLFFFFVSCVC